jgi:hypothetical protein
MKRSEGARPESRAGRNMNGYHDDELEATPPPPPSDSGESDMERCVLFLILNVAVRLTCVVHSASVNGSNSSDIVNALSHSSGDKSSGLLSARDHCSDAVRQVLPPLLPPPHAALPHIASSPLTISRSF